MSEKCEGCGERIVGANYFHCDICMKQLCLLNCYNKCVCGGEFCDDPDTHGCEGEEEEL